MKPGAPDNLGQKINISLAQNFFLVKEMEIGTRRGEGPLGN